MPGAIVIILIFLEDPKFAYVNVHLSIRSISLIQCDKSCGQGEAKTQILVESG